LKSRGFVVVRVMNYLESPWSTSSPTGKFGYYNKKG